MREGGLPGGDVQGVAVWVGLALEDEVGVEGGEAGSVGIAMLGL